MRVLTVLRAEYEISTDFDARLEAYLDEWVRQDIELVCVLSVSGMTPFGGVTFIGREN